MKEIYVLKNGRFYTCDKAAPEAEAVVIRDGKFAFVGNEKELSEFMASNGELSGEGEVIEADLGGRLVLPGLIDSHTHLTLSAVMGGDEEDEKEEMPVWDCQSKEEVLSRLKAHVKKHPFRLFYSAFFGQVEALGDDGLRREEIDRIVKHRPVVLVEKECHSMWLNSRALKYLGVNEDTPDISPGYNCYERDANGRLTGCIKEMTAKPLFELLADIPEKEIRAGLLTIVNYLADHGVTAIFDAGTLINEEKAYRILSEMDRAGELPVRVEATHMIVLPDMVDGAIDEFKRLKKLYETDNIRFKTMKLMLDGTHRIHTAKMIEPYCDTGTTGGTQISEERLYDFMRELNGEGIDFHLHTVGEGASNMVLNCVEKLIAEEGEADIIVTAAHLESLRDEDVPRFKELGVVADFTPHWFGGYDYSDHENTVKLLGEKRANQIMRAKTVMDSGAIVTFSSDEVSLAFLDRWNPYLGIETGHTRQEINDGGRDAPIFPPEDERLDIEALIEGYTVNPAYSMRLDDRIGSISAGKEADLVVLDRNIFEIDPYEIHEAKPELVMIRGKAVRGSVGKGEV